MEPTNQSSETLTNYILDIDPEVALNNIVDCESIRWLMDLGDGDLTTTQDRLLDGEW